MDGLVLTSIDVWYFVTIDFSFGASLEMDKEKSNLLQRQRLSENWSQSRAERIFSVHH